LPYQWEWDDGGVYMAYEIAVQEQIENSHNQGRQSVTITCTSTGGRRQYMLRFDKMVQVPAVEAVGSSLHEVPIRRQDINKQLPPTWTHQKEEVQVELVSTSSSDYQRVQTSLCERKPFSTGHVKIVKVERIQNKTLLLRYQTERGIATERRGADNLNEKYLFHGTRIHAPLKIAESPEGFLVLHTVV
jgi:hypothetical protein